MVFKLIIFILVSLNTKVRAYDPTSIKDFSIGFFIGMGITDEIPSSP